MVTYKDECNHVTARVNTGGRNDDGDEAGAQYADAMDQLDDASRLGNLKLAHDGDGEAVFGGLFGG